MENILMSTFLAVALMSTTLSLATCVAWREAVGSIRTMMAIGSAAWWIGAGAIALYAFPQISDDLFRALSSKQSIGYWVALAMVVMSTFVTSATWVEWRRAAWDGRVIMTTGVLAAWGLTAAIIVWVAPHLTMGAA